MRELRRDPQLTDIMHGSAGFPGPEPVPVRKLGWSMNDYTELGPEAAFALEAGTFVAAGAPAAGADLRFGFKRQSGRDDTTRQGCLLESLAGEGWGLDFHLRGLRERDSHSLFGAGFAVVATNVIGKSTSTGRVRTASLLGLLAPELGFFTASGEEPLFYMRNSLPFSVLVGKQLALEGGPSLMLRFAPERVGGFDALVGLSIGFAWRFPRARCP
jgi:hypothetical protein